MAYFLLMFRIALIFIAILSAIQVQGASFPLESVTLEGTVLSKDVVLELAGLHLGASVDPASFDAALQRLNATGLFESVNYHYAPGPHKGYALALSLSDPKSLVDAAIDIPGANVEEGWRWLNMQYPSLRHNVPANDAAQLFVARQVEEHFAALLDGHYVVGRLESDIRTRKSLISFQPDPLPRIVSIDFRGGVELTSDQLRELIPADVKDQGYTDRGFRQAVELNLGRAYEEHGMYRVRFPDITAKLEPGWTVAVTTSIEEGPKFTLGDVLVLGNDLPRDAMLKAANFRKNEIANWTAIQNSIWELEKPLKRMGYLDARAVPERVFHDDRHVLDLKLSLQPGPLYRFGELQIVGLPPNLQAEARKIWNLHAGDPFDYDYPREFFQAFFRSVDRRQFNRAGASMRKGSGESVMDFVLTFEPR